MDTPPPAFPHRHNRDGSYDSICVKCFATIATERIEEMLVESEQAHACRHKPMPYRLAKQTTHASGAMRP
jgi:hypothetical protein